MEDIFIQQGQLNFDKVSNAMIEMLAYCENLKNAPKSNNIEQAATRDRHRTTGLRFLEDEVTKLQKEPKTLTMFVYELRRLDT